MGLARAPARAFGLVLVIWLACLAAVYLYGLRDQARPADAIIVLGAAQYQGRPSPVLRARLDHAIALHRDSLAPVLIFTGGVGVGDTISEAEVGRRYALREGVEDRRIIVETAGLSTEQSMRTVGELMGRRGMSSAVLVSDPFHMLRLRLVAARHGISSYSSPTRSSPIREGTRPGWHHLLRESVILPLVLVGAH